MNQNRDRVIIFQRRRVALLRIIHHRMETLLVTIADGHADQASAGYRGVVRFIKILAAIPGARPRPVDRVERQLLSICDALNDRIITAFEQSLKNISREIFRNSVDKTIGQFILNKEESKS